jgi:hypothetical protein
VNQIDGPNARCDWLELDKHADGYMVGWLSGQAPGESVSREGWTPELSRSLRSYRPSEIQRVSKWSASPEQALASASEEAAIVKATGQIVYSTRVTPPKPDTDG